MKKGQLRQLVLSLGGGIGTFLILALLLRWNFLFSAALGVGVYLGLWFLLVPKADSVTLYCSRRPDGGEVLALMEEAGRDLKAIRSAAGRITDVQTHGTALALAETGERLYRYLRENPEKNRLGQPLSHLLSGYGGPDPGPVCEIPGCRAGDFRSAGVSEKGAGHPAQAENRI